MDEGEEKAGTSSAGIVGLLAVFALLCTVFAGAATLLDWLHGSGNIETDLQIVAAAALALAVLLPLARWMGAREKAAPHARPASGGRSVGAGLTSLVTGAIAFALGGYQLLTATRAYTLEAFLFVPIALMFSLAGVQLLLPPGNTLVKRVLAAMVLTCFAALFDWVAFGPGERHFSGGVSLGPGSVGGLHANEWLGRVLFGIPAAIASGIAVVLWARLPRASR